MASIIEPRYRLGVDVGGTNTDAVLIRLDPIAIVVSHKAPTTPDVTTGITTAVQAVIAAAKVPLSSIACVIIGTTHFVNAVVQRSPSLRRVAVIRLCGGPDEGFGRNIPPFVDYPLDLRARIEALRPYFCHGGYQISGEEISPLDETELESVAAQLVSDGVKNVVIAGMYAPLNHHQEMRAKEVLLRSMEKNAGPLYKARITLSHEVSGLGFLARENAAILNATLRPLAERTIYGFQKAMEDIFQDVPYTLYLTQNDGSVLSAAEAVHLPIRTFNSGPTNSIRGGEFLWRAATEAAQLQKEQATRTEPLVVIDIGGTTSDSGLLLPNGLPQMSSVTSLVGGVRTNFALPAVENIGLGGGSIVRSIGQDDCSVGPDSVALELLERARLFGGEYLTATDIAVASAVNGVTETNPLKGMGDVSTLTDITIPMVNQAQYLMRRKIEELVDRTKIHKDDVDVLIVGGGAPIIRTDEPLLGVRRVQTVKGGEVANAVGAAISRVSGVMDTVVDTSNCTVKEAQETVSQMAIDKALGNGAQPDTVQIAEVTMLPIQYVEAKARIVVRAVGELDIVSISSADKTIPVPDEEVRDTDTVTPPLHTINLVAPQPDLHSYRPHIQNNQWIISPTDLDFITRGCKILGCGGGGDPYQEYLKAKAYLQDHPGTVRIISPDSLPDESLVGWTGCMGSPEVSMERLENSECLQAHEELMRVTGSEPVSAFLALEIGGGNGMVNLGVAAHYGVPCLDADYMGRAYPTMWQVTPNVYGTPRGEALVPAAIASGDGTCMTMTRSRTDRLVDKAMRAAVVEMGCRAGSAGPPHRADRVRQQAIRNTVSLAWWIGRAVTLEKNIADKAMRIVEAAGGPESGAILGEGKVVSVSRVLKTGHSYGVLEVDGRLSDGRKATLNIPFKNENAYVEAVMEDGETKILAAVPDLIVVLDAESGAGLGTPEFKYGLKVVVLAIAASPRWTDTPRGMELGGPKSMGFEEVEYVPIGKYCEPRSVIDVFG
ncbi:hydantoinase/oxoprolinase [Aspergillus eucalypticola CBS 122712]|uniref:Hydantoinase/oxoprolinase n=1 Tax=Aspergillus eucalypticola (strain CBS 122712 / IBT 29274) TaxID=1448314 RepID=A0A317UJG7_ASPEC|nr:hydantoinase/oxoprolinase [Aspergillus eucalypticola CBS 122712]PWY62224.1 hydantoinase/oxoprolinase [Aspergillus eucalypticola CBS 122712]